MEVVITAKVMRHDRLGELRRGRQVDVPDHQARDWLQRGFARLPVPPSAAGTASSASPAAPASPQTTSSESAPGARRRRKKAEQSS